MRDVMLTLAAGYVLEDMSVDVSATIWSALGLGIWIGVVLTLGAGRLFGVSGAVRTERAERTARVLGIAVEDLVDDIERIDERLSIGDVAGAKYRAARARDEARAL